MNKAKKALLGTTLAGVLVVSAGFGTYSWFTSETKASGEITNGTLSINHGQDITEKVISGENFAPSQLKFGDWLTIDNTGSLNTHLKVTLNQSLDKNVPIGKYKVGYIALKYKKKPNGDTFQAAKQKLKNLFEGTTNEAKSLAANEQGEELAPGVYAVTGIVSGNDERGLRATSSKDWVLGDGTNGKFWRIKSDEYIDLTFGFKLDESAGNDYQGAKYTANLNVQAKQTDGGSQYESK
ncbi:hypothetical protein WD019_12810 [Fictibacillus sp. Mic-4]|uniref:hypothetical protein n=1 Tax=Fictibacillus sp. Mic-4 TaxID=3132826 RepID=UPI003CEC9057